MRPSRLEVSGFTAFREKATVEFDGADLFALTGPTGSGKSSLIDAMVFALYGSVPRIGQRDVAPVISLGKLEARVRFDFTLDGAEYTVVRVVRRTKTGATTAEARLEYGGEVVAGNADEVTAAVERLLGLGFDHFIKSVVLPQGQFAAFLHDRPADRQKLLRELLDLGVYEHMRDLAKQRRAAAEAEGQLLAAQLDELAFATPEAERTAANRLRRLEELQAELDEAEPALHALRTKLEELATTVTETRTSIALLERVTIPPTVEALAEKLAKAREAASEALATAEGTGNRLEESEQARAALPPPGELDRIVDLHETLSAERVALTEQEEQLAKATAAVTEDGKALEAAQAELTTAQNTLDDIKRLHAAHALAVALAVGEPCPVCRQPVTELPTAEAPTALTEAEQALAVARTTAEKARTTATETRQAVAAQEARIQDLSQRVLGVEAQLATAPSLESARQGKAAIAEADGKLETARQAAKQAAAAYETARRTVEDLEGEAAVARRDFDQTRDRVASMEPPIPERRDLSEDWQQLAGWAQETTEQLTASVTDTERKSKEIGDTLTGREAGLTSRLEAAGLYVEDGRPRDVAVAAVANATHELTRIREAIERAATLRESISERRTTADVAKTLGRHLSATGFEAWLMEEALATLVAGANLLLGDLAGGAYSLEVVKRDFRVIDHRNADEVRGVKTLSGGETFLVSLALALSLAEQLAAMSVHGGGRLESIFLDEGFGTLDAETLDTVAHVIQELGAQGRTVGIVTHVRELAEQVPVRFEVRKGPGTATVDRVEL